MRGRSTAVLVLCGVVALGAQTPKPTFEVTSVKALSAQNLPVPPLDKLPKNAFHWAGTVVSLVRFAYHVQDAQLIGGPDWIRQDLFEVNARPVDEVRDEQVRLMAQSLLEDRFQLAIHREARQMRFSVVRMARAGGKLGGGITPCRDKERLPESQPISVSGGGVIVITQCAPITMVADLASTFEGVPVVDKTGLSGLWTFAFSDNEPWESHGPRRRDPQWFSTALQAQLGFRLESQRGRVDVLVIDWVQQPTEN